MSCPECEQAIYTYREIGADEKEKIKQHAATCDKCQKLFNEVEEFSQQVKKVSGDRVGQNQLNRLTDKVMDAIQDEQDNEKKVLPTLNLSLSRFALAAVSCGILVLFFMEVLIPDLQSGKIKGPISNIQGAIIKSEDFRKVFTRPKEKKSLFDDCKNVLTNQVDANCIKEKLNNINL